MQYFFVSELLFSPKSLHAFLDISFVHIFVMAKGACLQNKHPHVFQEFVIKVSSSNTNAMRFADIKGDPNW